MGKGKALGSQNEKFIEDLWDFAEKGHLTKEIMAELSHRYSIPLSSVESVASFYSQPENVPVKVCNGLPCRLKTTKTTEEFIRELGSNYEPVSCLGYCDHAPVLWKNGRYYQEKSGAHAEIENSIEEQTKKASETIEQYLGNGGYGALLRFAGEQNRGFLLSAVEKESLRGMGGAGFPAHIKWKAVMSSNDAERYLLVNAHEGESGTFKDRVLIETTPHALLEGAVITALEVSASHVVIAIKREYRNARIILTDAIKSFREYIEDKNIQDLLPSVSLIPVAGYYVTGEETALMEAIEGKRSEPRIRPPFPAESGLYGKPTLVHNVETLVYVLDVLKNHYGKGDGNRSMKSYCLTGDVNIPGVYRLPIGTSASLLVEREGGTASRNLKAFFPGGLSGGIFPASHLSTPLDFDSVRKKGGGMGTGALIAISNDRCMVEIMKTVSEFFASESCGKCVPCRLGTVEMFKLLNDLSSGQATKEDLETGEETARLMQETSICALGQVAGKAFLDSMKHFSEEFLVHTEKKCPVNVCFKRGDSQ